MAMFSRSGLSTHGQFSGTLEQWFSVEFSLSQTCNLQWFTIISNSVSLKLSCSFLYISVS